MENDSPDTSGGGIAKVHAVVKAGGNSTSGEVGLDVNNDTEVVRVALDLESKARVVDVEIEIESRAELGRNSSRVLSLLVSCFASAILRT
jgi:hypothetical protein